jgi:hypothetical protein
VIGRRPLLRTIGGLTLAGMGAAGYGFWIEPAWRLVVQDYALVPPGWPPGLRATLAVLTDIHAADPQMPLRRLERIVAATNALRPDLVVLLGDHFASGRFSGRAIPLAETAAVLRGLSAPLGVHGVLGNHDWWEDAEVQRLRGGLPWAARTLSDAGLPVLHNSAVRLAPGFWLAGLGSLWAYRGGRRFSGADDLDAAVAGVADGEPVILLCHEPDIFPRVPARVSLTLCGHTHGGQVRLGGWSPVVPSIHGSRYAYGHVVEGGRHLIVSGGLGTSLLPVRLGVPPEITLVRLGEAV